MQRTCSRTGTPAEATKATVESANAEVSPPEEGSLTNQLGRGEVQRNPRKEQNRKGHTSLVRGWKRSDEKMLAPVCCQKQYSLKSPWDRGKICSPTRKAEEPVQKKMPGTRGRSEEMPAIEDILFGQALSYQKSAMSSFTEKGK